MDLYPTLLEIAGGTRPADYPLDGESYLKLLLRGGKGTLKRDAIFWHFPGYLGAGANAWRTTPGGAIRSGDWRLQEYFEDGRLELYNLRDDLSQTNNLAASNPSRTKELHAKLVAWRKELNAPMPTKNTAQSSGPPAGKQKKKKAGAAND